MRRRQHIQLALASTLCCLIICAALVSTPPALARQGHTIRGKVRTSAGYSVPRVTVSLESGSGALINQTVTNNEGDFFFGGLEDTSYQITISAPDYNPASERVEFVRNVGAGDPGETRTVEITLVGRGGVRPPRAGLNFAQNVPKAARDAYELSLKHLKENRAPDALVALREATRIFPDYFDAHFLLASEHIKQNKLSDAITELNEAQRINPKDDRVWHAFGSVLMQQRKFAVAARVFAEAARLSPNDPQYPLLAGTALIEQAATIDPSKTEERNYALGEAEKSLARAYQLSERKLAAVHLQLARLHERRGDRARAADELEQYLRQSPDLKNAAAIREAVKTLRAPAATDKKTP
ncbi:MAG TPA: tetratricopeptide repeat protein [Pyrinomonadaceae bacterium]|nr:tetratricopeptide repeat protein [Pyrinomonadaceae bacterium]